MANYQIRSKKEDLDICVIIPAAGMGKRMKSYGPKSLIKLDNNTTILERQVSIVSKVFANYTGVIVCGFEAEKLFSKVPKGFIKIENELYLETNVVRSIAMGIRAVDAKNVLVIYGDLVFTKEAISEIDYSSSSMSIIGTDRDDEEVGCVIGKDGLLQHMMYDLPQKWSQIIFLKEKELELFKKIAFNKKNKKLFGFEAINKVIEEGGQIRCALHKDINVIDVDTSKDLAAAKTMVN